MYNRKATTHNRKMINMSFAKVSDITKAIVNNIKIVRKLVKNLPNASLFLCSEASDHQSLKPLNKRIGIT